MGEHLFVGPQHVKIEPHAHDQPLRTLPTLSHLFADKLQSEFSQSLPECSKSSSIGSYYCNEVYKTALKWSNNSDQRPVTFIHTPVLGDRSKHIDQVFKVLDKMQASRTITPEV